MSDNASSADNQQERPYPRDTESSETVCRAPNGEDTVRTAWRHAEAGGNVRSNDSANSSSPDVFGRSMDCPDKPGNDEMGDDRL